MEILSKYFVEFIECCVARDVKFLIVGGYALAAHGHPRATKDLDVWIQIGAAAPISAAIRRVTLDLESVSQQRSKLTA